MRRTCRATGKLTPPPAPFAGLAHVTRRPPTASRMETEMARRSDRMETIVSLSKRRGIVFPSSEIYGGLRAAWEIGRAHV